MAHLNVHQRKGGKVFIVGDIHGHLTKFYESLFATSFCEENDIVVCTGDIIDRGPESFESLFLIEKPWFFTVKGNHEYTAEYIWSALINDQVDVKLHTLMSQWMEPRNGGAWFETLNTKQKVFCLTQGLRLLSSLPLAITINMLNGEKFGVVHAAPYKEGWSQARYNAPTNEDIRHALNCRSLFELQKPVYCEGVSQVFVGHNVTPNHQLLQLGNIIHIDTGAWRSNAEHEFLIVELQPSNSSLTVR